VTAAPGRAHGVVGTRLCISVAARPGTLGTRLHNAGYRALGLDYVYVALSTADIAGAVQGVRALNIRGCSVSMPFKVSVMDHLDAIDGIAASIGAVNTIVNDDGVLTGYNTDAVGARRALQTLSLAPADRILILGAGGAARAVLHALGSLGVGRVLVSCRDMRAVEAVASVSPACTFVPWEDREKQGATVVINATPIGMHPEEMASPLGLAGIADCRAVFDVVVRPRETRLLREARAMGKLVVDGLTMALYQAATQFFHYTGQHAPLDVFARVLAEDASEGGQRA